MRNIDFKRTERGFSRVDFDDLYGARCSLQKSSLATEDAIWLGQNEPTVHPVTGEVVGCRMHLTQRDVRWLLPMLTHFAETGELPAAIDPGSAALPRKDVEGALYDGDPFASEPNHPAGIETDDAAPSVVLAMVRHCASLWVKEARIIGNIRAGDIVRAIDAMTATLTAERASVIEMCAKVADGIAAEARMRRDDAGDDDDAVSVHESHRVTASYVAAAIRDIGKQTGGQDG